MPIWIGVNEGNAIALEMQGEKFPRPLTHDLIVNMLKSFNATVEKVVVTDLRENSYFALITIHLNGKAVDLDARPSDSLALAVRIHCPIYIDEKVLKKCPKIEKPITQEEIEKFKDTLKTMTPEEFFKNLEETPAPQEPVIGDVYGEETLDEPGEEDLDDEEDDEQDKPFK